MATQLPNLVLEYCVRDQERDTITNKEKAVAMILICAYLPLVYITVGNLVKYYDQQENKKEYRFMPTMNILLFTCIYSRIVFPQLGLQCIWMARRF